MNPPLAGEGTEHSPLLGEGSTQFTLKRWREVSFSYQWISPLNLLAQEMILGYGKAERFKQFAKIKSQNPVLLDSGLVLTHRQAGKSHRLSGFQNGLIIGEEH